MKQAQLYLDLGSGERAVSTIEKCVAAEPGRSDALAWLLLAKAWRDVRALDKAGQALERAKELGVEARLKEAAWASEFLYDFEDRFGAVQVIEPLCGRISFNIAVTSSVSAEMQNVLESLPGWTDNRFVRRTRESIYLPAGTFRIGELEVDVVAGKSFELRADEVAAVCLFEDRDSDGIGDELDKCPDVAEDRDGVEDADGCVDLDPEELPVFWIVVGAVAAAALGGTAITLAATKEVYFDINFTRPGR